jgi:Transposase DDE domain
MFTEEHRSDVRRQLHERGVLMFAQFLTPDLFLQAAKLADCRIVSSPLSIVNMVWLGLACALESAKSFAAILNLTLKILNDAPSASVRKPLRKPPKNRTERRADKARSKHDPRRDDPTNVSEEAFVQARDRMPLKFWISLTFLIADLFARQHDKALRWNGFRLLALDGTLVNLPRWKRLADYFGVAKGSRGGKVPQARIVMLLFPMARLPFRYALAGKNQAEKPMAEPLVEALNEHDLVLMDRGFWSYGLFHAIAEKKAFFAIRQIAQAHLKHVRDLGPDDTLVEFAPTDRKWRKLGLPVGMELRRIVYQVPGFRPSAIITNMTDPQRISRADWVGMTMHQTGQVLDRSVYHRRWEIETSFRELKVVQEMKVLRGRTPKTIEYEIASHVLFYLLVRLLIMEAAIKYGLDPLRLSFTEALREIEEMVWAFAISSQRRVKGELYPSLLSRIAQHVVPERPGRSYPRPKDGKTRKIGYGQKKMSSKLAA